MFIIWLFACSDKELDTGIEDTAAAVTDEVPVATEILFAAQIESGSSRSDLVTLGEQMETLETHGNSSWEPVIREKSGYLWVLTGGLQEVVEKRSADSSATLLAEYVLDYSTPVFPRDVEICGENLFLSLYDHTELMVLDPDTLEERERIDLSAYADDDGYPEPSTMVCKDDSLYVSLHRWNRMEDPQSDELQQVGSIVVSFHAETLEEIHQFDEQGYRTDIFDIPNTPYLLNVVRVHQDVFGATPGGWVFDPAQNIYREQIYFATGSVMLLETAIGSNYVVYHGVEFNQNQNAFVYCLPLTPDIDVESSSRRTWELESGTQLYGLSMGVDGLARISFAHSDSDTSNMFGVYTIDPSTCTPAQDAQYTEKLILDFELISAMN